MSNYMSLIPKIEEITRQIMGNNFGHGYPHVRRVRTWAYKIISNERLKDKIDAFVLEASILLHDIGRRIGEPHAYYSAIIAEGLLKWLNVENHVIEKITNAILYHSYSYSLRHNIEPIGYEPLILSDADKLDALGLVGFIRVFDYSCIYNRSLRETISHFYDKIFNLKNYMYFDYSRKSAEKLTRRTRDLLKMLEEEMELYDYLE